MSGDSAPRKGKHGRLRRMGLEASGPHSDARERDRLIFSLGGAELEMWEEQGGKMTPGMRARLREWYREEGERSAVRAERQREARIKARQAAAEQHKRDLAKRSRMNLRHHAGV